MALPSSGTITMAAIAAEMGVSLPIGLTDSNVRQLCGVPSGTVTMPTHFYGKSWAPVPTLEAGSIYGSASTDGVISTTATGSDSVIVSAGVPSYTYLWTITGGAVIFGSATSNTLTISYTSNTPSFVSGTYKCTVTGANGVSANTATGNYTLEITSL